jgi:Ferredoxin-like domain in Api92-like protein
MPNWCNNSVTLKHKDPAVIERAVKAYQEGRLLQEFIPVPKELTDTVAGYMGEDKRAAHEAQQVANINKYGYKDWYDFCVAEWGTKWDIGGTGEFIEQVDANTIQISFDSAWSPPCSAYEKLCAQGFEIEAFYDECGMAFCGKWTGNEDDFYDDYYEYGGETAETIRKVVGEELDDHWGLSDRMAEWEEMENE